MKNQFQGGGGGGVCIEKSIRGGGGSELSDQLLDPDVPTLASQDKLKVSPKGLPFVTWPRELRLLVVSPSLLSPRSPWPINAQDGHASLAVTIIEMNARLISAGLFCFFMFFLLVSLLLVHRLSQSNSMHRLQNPPGTASKPAA